MRDSSAVRITLPDPIGKDRNYLRAGHRARELEERTLDDWERLKLSKSQTPSERVGGEDAGRLGKTETI